MTLTCKWCGRQLVARRHDGYIVAYYDNATAVLILCLDCLLSNQRELVERAIGIDFGWIAEAMRQQGYKAT